MSKVLEHATHDEIAAALHAVLQVGLDFKYQDRVASRYLVPEEARNLIADMPDEGQPLESVLAEFKNDLLPYCINYSSRNFMGFPDAGHSVAAVSGAILKELLQQDLLNARCCGPSATFAEISVIRWLREAVGYQVGDIHDVWDVGGAVTPGGTLSNAVAMLLARENKRPGTMRTGIGAADEFWIVIPEHYCHYSIKASAMWLGCGARFLEVTTKDYRYDLGALERTLRQHADKVMAVVAFAGDSKTMTVDALTDVHDITRSHSSDIWLHADACHGFSLAFSEELRHKLRGIELFDSISMDPHKVMLVPYTLSVLAVRNPSDMRKIQTQSRLIVDGDWDLGQITPFVGTKPWDSLKLWFMMKHFGKRGLDELISRRHRLARYLGSRLEADRDFVVVNEVDINAVNFLYAAGVDAKDVSALNRINQAIHQSMVEAGRYYLHQFPLVDAGRIEKGAVVYPLRFMSGNPATSADDVDDMVEYIRALGRQVTSDATASRPSLQGISDIGGS